MSNNFNFKLKELFNLVNTGSNKAKHIEQLGHFLYTIYPKPDAEFTAAIRRITTHRNQLKVLSVYYSSFLIHNGYQELDNSVNDLTCELYQGKEKKSICELYILIARDERFENDKKDIVLMLKKAAVLVKEIGDSSIRNYLIPQITLCMKRKVPLDELLDIIRSFEDKKYDSMPEAVYEVITDPLKSKNFDAKVVQEVYNRNANDWTLWCLLSQNIPDITSEPVLHFKYIIHISRFSLFEKDNKVSFLEEFVENLRLQGPSKDLLQEIKRTNKEMDHSISNKKMVARIINPLFKGLK